MSDEIKASLDRIEYGVRELADDVRGLREMHVERGAEQSIQTAALANAVNTAVLALQSSTDAMRALAEKKGAMDRVLVIAVLAIAAIALGKGGVEVFKALAGG